MHTFITLILLQLSLFGGKSTALKGAKLYLEETRSEKIVSYVEIGNSGAYIFNNMDPGNYNIIVELSEDQVTRLDKRLKDNFETDIAFAFNIDKSTFCYQLADGFIKIEIDDEKKINERFEPLFEDARFSTQNQESQNSSQTENANLPSWMTDVPHTGEEKDFVNEEKENTAKDTSPIKVRILKFTVVEEFGQIGLNLQSITQKEFYKLTVGKADLPLETIGDVEVLKRLE